MKPTPQHEKRITTPLTDEIIRSLSASDMVSLTGVVYTARDAAHKRLADMIKKDEPLPFDFEGQIVYYAGPCPNRPEHVIGSIGPTTSGRMDAYSPLLIEKGLKAMIGKGMRDDVVTAAIQAHGGIYFAAIGGAAALMSKCVRSVEMIAFEDLGPEAIRKLTVVDLPIIVAIDAQGQDIYKRLTEDK